MKDFRRVLAWPGLIAKLAARGEWREILYRMRVILLNLDFQPLTPAESLSCPPPGYAPSGGPELEGVLRDLEIQPHDAIVDLGAGKGAALITFSRFPFSRIAGVELNAGLAAIARRNLRRVRATIDVFCEDARVFNHFGEFSHIYLYNPFHEDVMAPVLDRISEAARSKRQQVRLIYKIPRCHDLLLSKGWRLIREYSEIETRVYELERQGASLPLTTEA